MSLGYFSKHNNTLNEEAVNILIDNPQMLLFNNTFFFVWFLYVFRKNFLSAEVLTRYKTGLLSALFKHGIYLSAFYSALTYLILVLISLSLGANIETNLFAHSFKLFSFCIYVYMVYLVIYLRYSKHVIALLTNVIINFTFLISLLTISFVKGDSDFYGFVNNNLYVILIFIAFMLMVYVSATISKREYL
ncbi:hypothetical protein PRVXT_002409 [Proteinivorax tanatarense]|uniref:Uncharacterized protein n=1 Tax=Proteinivorax tanatarense TaxID=1260629 RepID=A0AAU7VK87_9FIRM